MTGAYMTYGALCAKTRALYGKRLRLNDYQRMASLPGETELLDDLRRQPGWSLAVARLDEAGYVGRVELEAVLWDQVEREYEALEHYVPRRDKLIMRFPVLMAEQRSILWALRRLKGGGPTSPAPAGRLLERGGLDGKALAECRDYQGLCDACRDTVYSPPLLSLRAPEPDILPDYTATETLLQSAYFSYMYRVIHQNYAGETRRVLLRSYGEQIDLLNVIHILRLKTYFPGFNSYLAVLFPFNYRLSPAFIRALITAPDVEAAFELLRSSPYARSFENVQVTEVEDYYRRAFYSFNRRQLITGPPSIYTAMAYLNLKELELRTLVNVIESVKYGVPFDDAFARLIGD